MPQVQSYTQSDPLPAVGAWRAGETAPAFDPASLLAAIHSVRSPLHVVRESPQGRVGVGVGGEVEPLRLSDGRPAYPLLATLPALYPEWLGDRGFGETHGVRFPYVAGAMANGIATTELVIRGGARGMLGFFGAAGLGYPQVEQALDAARAALGGARLALGR